MYTGFIKDRKPHGKGCLVEEDKTIVGEFKEGQLYQELKESNSKNEYSDESKELEAVKEIAPKT